MEFVERYCLAHLEEVFEKAFASGADKLWTDIIRIFERDSGRNLFGDDDRGSPLTLFCRGYERDSRCDFPQERRRHERRTCVGEIVGILYVDPRLDDREGVARQLVHHAVFRIKE